MLINIKRIISLRAGAALLTAAAAQTAFSGHGMTFTATSPLSEGNWVKVGVNGGGVCRISYDELRDMGFGNPESVAVFGRGADMFDGDFKDAEGNDIYSDRLPAVSTMHHNNAIYFYSRGPVKLQYTDNGVDRVSNNVYTTKAYYFLTDTGKDASLITAPVSTNAPAPDKSYSTALGYQLLEEDNLYPFHTGEEFFGWDLKSAPGGKVSLPYSLPGAIAGSDVKLACKGVAKIVGPDAMVFSLKSGETTNEIGKMNFMNLATDAYYSYSGNGSSVFLSGKLPGAEGELIVSDQYPARSTFSALDYVVVTAPRSLAMQEGEKWFEVYTPDYTAAAGPVAIASAPADLVVWDVADSNDVIVLPYTLDEAGTAYVSGLRENKRQGALVAFSASAPLLGIDSYKRVVNQNLHSIAAGEIPAMLIITTPELKAEAERLAAIHKNYQNEHVAVAVSEQIINEFTQGTPDPMAYKALVRMIYDADNADSRTFSSVLLLGAMRADNRGIDTPLPDYTLLLCKETTQSDAVTNSFTIPDFHVQMADHYGDDKSGNNYFTRTQDLAVGVIPAESPEVARLYVNKIEAWLNDTSVASWLGTVIYTADGSNENEHISESELAAISWNDIDNAFTANKLYNNSYPDSEIRPHFLRTIEDGTIWTNYLGHASNRGLNTLLWDKGDFKKLTNDRLGFIYLGGCSISDFEHGARGSGEEMILSTPHGVMGGIMSNRTTLSTSNFLLLCDLIKAALKESPFGASASDALLSSPRTFGEITRMAMNANTRGNSNKLAYVLMCDPALRSLMPSASISLKIDGKAAAGDVEVYPGSEITLSGSIDTRDGKLIDGFNGELYAKLYAPYIVMPTRTVGDSKSIDIIHDNIQMATVPIEVTDGRFSGTFRIPEGIGEPGSKLTLRLTAFDFETRRTATASQNLVSLPFTEGKSEVDNENPVIEKFYADSPSFNSGDAVGPDPVLFAVITDNAGMNPGGHSADTAFSLSIDGRIADTNLSQFATLGDEGRQLSLRYPLKGLVCGMHTAAIKAFDNSGNSCASVIQFNVQPAVPSMTSLAVESSLVRDKVTVTASTPSDAGYTPAEATLIITDALGNVVKTIAMDSDSADWDVTDADGKRVAEGVYYARCRFITASGAAGVTEPTRLVVIRDKNK